VDGIAVAEGRIARTVPDRFSLDEGLDVGVDIGTPETKDDRVPIKLTGKLDKVTVELT
jgi:arylsulfatase